MVYIEDSFILCLCYKLLNSFRFGLKNYKLFDFVTSYYAEMRCVARGLNE
jgi:hypothetical protein